MKRARRKDGAMLLGAGAFVLLLTVSAIAFLPCVSCPSKIHYLRVWHANMGNRPIPCVACGRDTSDPIPRISLFRSWNYRFAYPKGG